MIPETGEPAMSYNSPDVTFVVSRSGNPSIFEQNFAVSPFLQDLRSDRIIVQEGFSSAAAAYNDAMEKADTDLIVFAHQDVYFPKEWLADLDRSLKILEKSDPSWGVIGCAGAKHPRKWSGYLYSEGLGIIGAPFDRPVPIDALDEFILVLRKSSGLRFDESIPHFHFYGTDICMAAREEKKGCYAISAFTVHNTSYGPLAPEFYECYWHVRKKWSKFLPIKTPCIRITRWNDDLIYRRVKHACFSLLGKEMKVLPRLEDPRRVLQSVHDPRGKNDPRNATDALIRSK
jgi:hypothetical protein